jgi:hypothetical protein
MLSGYQCEAVAFIAEDGCEYLCRSCAEAETSALTVEKAERGLTNAYGLRGIIRYEVDTWDGERTWEAAQERVDSFASDHPAIFEALVENDRNVEWRLTDRIADRLGDTFHERCGQCGEPLA